MYRYSSTIGQAKDDSHANVTSWSGTWADKLHARDTTSGINQYVSIKTKHW